jgi:peptidyl-prolyl cis-trans isomerase C
MNARRDSPTPARSFGVTIVLSWSLACGCSDSSEDQRRTRDRAALLRSRSEADDIVVATVDGVPIHARDVAAQARRKHVDRKEALQDLIEFELLAAEAQRRGLHDSREVIQEGKRTSVQQYLAATFEKDFTRSDVPEHELRAAYEKAKAEYVHPELRKSVHILVVTGDPNAKTPVDKTLDAQARSIANRVRDLARSDAKDAASFLELAERVKKELGDPKAPQIRAENLPPTPVTQLEGPFAEVLFRMTPNTVSDPVRTRYGWHVIYLESIDRARDLPFKAVRNEILEKIWPDQHSKAFQQFVEDLASGHQIVRNDAPLKKGS